MIPNIVPENKIEMKHVIKIVSVGGQVQAIVPSGGQISSLYIFNKLYLILKLRLWILWIW